MAFVITEPCVDVHDRACVDECPVDCIYDGVRKGYIIPTSASTAVRVNPSVP